VMRAPHLLLFCCLLLGCKQDPPPVPAPASTGADTSTAAPGAGAPSVDRPRGLLAVGTRAPEFSVRAHNGQEVALRDLRGQLVVLYFYPKDGTPGCTVEAQEFTRAHADLKAAGAVVLGVSSDDSESHVEFAREHGLPFLLLPDEEHALARAFGVKTTFGMTQRVTFIIDREGVVARVYEDVTPKKHAQQILADLAHL